MASQNNYYHNAHGYFVEIPLTYGGSLSVAPGKYVEGSADTGATFPRLAALGVLTDDGIITDPDTGAAPELIAADPSLLIFTEPVAPLTGDKGDTGIDGTAVAKGDTGTVGSTGVAGAKGSTGVGDTGAAGAKGDTGTAGAKGDTGTAGPQGDTGVAGT